MPDSCCAIGCTNRRGDKPGLCFYIIPSDKDNPVRRRFWICAIKRNIVSREGKQWQPSKYTRICCEHFIEAIKKLKRQKDMERYKQHSRMKKKRQDAADVLLDPSSLPDAEQAPLSEDEQQCDSRPCKEKTERLQRECNELREENQRLKDVIKCACGWYVDLRHGVV